MFFFQNYCILDFFKYFFVEKPFCDDYIYNCEEVNKVHCLITSWIQKHMLDSTVHSLSCFVGIAVTRFCCVVMSVFYVVFILTGLIFNDHKWSFCFCQFFLHSIWTVSFFFAWFPSEWVFLMSIMASLTYCIVKYISYFRCICLWCSRKFLLKGMFFTHHYKIWHDEFPLLLFYYLTRLLLTEIKWLFRILF